MGKITNKDVVSHYTNTHKNDKSDKFFPNLMLVRSFSFLTKNERNKVLDYGCGYGANTVFMLSKGADVCYADTSPYAVNKTRKKVEDNAIDYDIGRSAAVVINKDADILPFSDKEFDVVVCTSVMSLLSDIRSMDELLSEFYRVLKPGGRLYVDINGEDSEFAYYSTNLGNNQYKYRGRNGDSAPIVAYCPKTLEDFSGFVSTKFTVLQSGSSQHSLFDYREQEFIVIGEK